VRQRDSRERNSRLQRRKAILGAVDFGCNQRGETSRGVRGKGLLRLPLKEGSSKKKKKAAVAGAKEKEKKVS